ncbi:unnamed protein product [Cylicocyclus nassatus]|uniref:Replication-associated protein ORF2/G2P domain-containing protein n=1 Tax=Cylicocyclus nassatus TaxID=53992 RepID=A0AA36GHY8_CYLNA|nr:unnamed protein product [Cylicocyclus nassatus]
MKIKGVNRHGIQRAFVPCGKCEECRNMERSAWQFRFQCEVEEYVYHKGTCCSPLFVPVPCFSKKDIRDLIHGLRKHLNKKYGVKRLVYLVCSEYGENTKRPHYHASFLFPPEVPAEEFYQCIRDLWCAEEKYIGQTRRWFGNQYRIVVEKARRNKGFTCPRQFEGYGREKPFLVSTGDASHACIYTAKYVSKDVYYLQDLPYDKLNFDNSYMDIEECEDAEIPNFEKLPDIRNYLPFHMQTRSLGMGILHNKSDHEIMDLFKNGVHFTGSTNAKPQCVPTYIKNKILFTPYYIVGEDGRRLVRRQASEFFNKNYKEVYKKKVDFYEGIIKDLSNSDFFKSRNLPSEQADKWAKEVGSLVSLSGMSNRLLAEGYVLYYGIDYNYSYRNENDRAMCKSELISYDDWTIIQNFWSIVLGLHGLTTKRDKTDEEKLIDMVADYHKHLDESAFVESGYIKENEYAF